MGLRTRISGLGTNTKAALIFATCVIPPVIAYLTEVPPPSLRLLAAAILGGVLAFSVKVLDSE